MKKYRLAAISMAAIITAGTLCACQGTSAGGSAESGIVSGSASESGASSGSGSSFVSSSAVSSEAAKATIEALEKDGLTEAAALSAASEISDGVTVGKNAVTAQTASVGMSEETSSAISSAGIQTVGVNESDTTPSEKTGSESSVVFSQSSAAATGAGISVSGTTVTLTKAGTYVISGSCTDGQLIIDCSGSGTVNIILDSLSLASESTSPFFVKDASKVVVSLPSGSTSSLADGKDYTLSDDATDAAAVIFSKSDLVINGSGTLNVTAGCNNGIASKDTLIITGGSINISSVDDGIIGKDCVVITGGVISMNVAGDGIRSTNTSEAALGFVQIDGGSFYVTSGADAFQAASGIIITGGDFNICSGGGSGNASTSENAGMPGGFGNWQTGQGASDDDTQSAKGFKGAVLVSIIDGKFSIDSSDDAIHSNGTVTIDGGIFSVKSGDDGIHADSTVCISSGYIDIIKSYEGIEGQTMKISGGAVSVTASDDGVNGSGGNDSSGFSGRPGQGSFSSGSAVLYISGGILRVSAAGDGIDVNGSIYISGGAVTVFGPTDDGNGGLDYDSACEITGGYVAVLGSAGMLQTASSGSTQCSIAVSFSSNIAAGSTASICDSAGNELLKVTSEKLFRSVVFSSPDIKIGNSYTVTAGDQTVTVDVSSVVTTSGTSGTGMGNPGGGTQNGPGTRPGGFK